MIGKEKAGESSKSRGRSESTTSHRSRSRDDRGEKSKSANQNFAPHVKDLIQVTIRCLSFCQLCFNILQLADNRSAEEEHDLGTGEGRQLQVREGLGVLHQHVQEAGSRQLFTFEGWLYEIFLSRPSTGQLRRSWSISTLWMLKTILAENLEIQSGGDITLDLKDFKLLRTTSSGFSMQSI